mgnify:FL=1
MQSVLDNSFLLLFLCVTSPRFCVSFGSGWKPSLYLLKNFEEGINQSLVDLLHSISVHFAHEQLTMRASGYDQLDTHKKDHELFLDVLRDITDCQCHAPQKSHDHHAKLLSNWFIGHFSTHDTRLHNKLGPHYQTNIRISW